MSPTSSSSVVLPPRIKNEVFLSFRGEDTRHNFVSHLYSELCHKKIKTFIDYTIESGDEIKPALDTAIEESEIYVIIFSENYASSRWCLDELTKILDCKKRYGSRHVIPVFYNVDPATIRHQKEKYAEAFAKHEDRFKDEMNKVNGWRAALTEAAELSGLDSQQIRSERTLVEKIVKDILTKLNRLSKLNSSSISEKKGFIGIEKHVAEIQSLMQLDSPSIRLIGISGIGGIGKTTIARETYDKLALQFDSSSLILNCQEEIERHGVQCLRRKILSELLKEERYYSDERLKRTRVLLILDDVNDSCELQDLIQGHGYFGVGSRIIVTSRDVQVIRDAEADKIYEVKELNPVDSLRLFCLSAFKQIHPKETYEDLSVKVSKYARGIPLALKVLGSLLCNRRRESWEGELQKLERLPELKIFNVLKTSYDGLDEEQKEIFLDIACFYRGHEEIVVAQTLDDCGFSANIGMDVLKDKNLISVLEGRIEMDDLIQEMGQEIVRQQCVENPGKRSRLWKVKEIYKILSKNKGSDAIQSISLDVSKIKELKLDAETFGKMDSLRILDFYRLKGYGKSNVCIASYLKSLPESLKILRWDSFPQRSLPPNFCPENLVRLEMSHSHLTQLWKGDQYLPNLKRLNLSYSRKLIEIPDLSLSPNIEEIILTGCKKLIKVYSSEFLSKLSSLCLDRCYELRSVTIPSNILSTSPGLILLSNCHKLQFFSTRQSQSYCLPSISQRFSDIPTMGQSQRFLRPLSEIFSITFERYEEEQKVTYISGKVSRELDGVSLNFQRLNNFCLVDLSFCDSLPIFPLHLSEMKFLKQLCFSGCSKLENFPEIEDTMEHLEVIILDETSIQALPSSLCRLVGLQELSLHWCTSLQIIPSSIGTLTKLCKLNLTHCESLRTFPSSIFKLKLRKLDLSGCSKLRTFPDIVEPAQTFAHIDLTNTAIKVLPSSFDNLIGLRTLRLNMCTNLESLPNSIVNLNLLSKLDCSGCAELTEIPRDIGRLSLLMELSLDGCGIANLPESIAHLSNLKSLDLSDCKKLECIPQIPPSLKQLVALDCPSIRRVMSNSLISNPSNSKEGLFKFYITNAQQLDPVAGANIVEHARLRMTEDAYRTVCFCFPGSAVPDWFPFRGKGDSVTINTDLSFCRDDRLIGFALCVVFDLLDTNDIEGRYGYFPYSLKFESDDGTHIIPNNDVLNNYFQWKGKRFVDQHHTFMWKYNLETPRKRGMSLKLCDARSFTFEIRPYDCLDEQFDFRRPYLESVVTIKECGICPLYTKEKDDKNAGADDYSGSQRYSESDIEESSGSDVAKSLMEAKEDTRGKE